MERVARRKGRRHKGLEVKTRTVRVLRMPMAWAMPRLKARVAMPERDLAWPGRYGLSGSGSDGEAVKVLIGLRRRVVSDHMILSSGRWNVSTYL